MSYCEMPQFFSGSWPIARKEHTCCECGRTIHIGERYGRFSGKWDNAFNGLQQFKQHLECEAACRFIRDYLNNDECIGFGELFEVWRDFLVTKEIGAPLKQKYQDFRTLMAMALWRKRKGFRLSWLKTRYVLNESLMNDRNRGYA